MLLVARLAASKSRVAPLKTISIPRLELSACLLLTKMIRRVMDAVKPNFSDICIRLYSDSTIALAWIRTAPKKLKTFVGNRVSKIQTLT